MSDEAEQNDTSTDSTTAEPADDNSDKDETNETNEEGTNEDEDEDVDDEADDEEEEEDDEDAYIVREVTDIRFFRGVVQFKTIWESDGSTTWEPIASFPNGEEHAEIKRFKATFPEKYAEKTQKSKKKPKQTASKLWTYVPLENLADKHEKVDLNASREAKSLYDPNRLEDPEEAFLKNYDTGVRVSRSKSREMRMNIESSSADSSVSIDSSPTKKGGPSAGRNQKRKEKVEREKKEEKLESKTKEPRKRKRAAKPPTSSSSKSESDSAMASTSLAPTLGYKLNSSDSSDNDSNHEPLLLRRGFLSSAQSESDSSQKDAIPISKLPTIPKKKPTEHSRKRSPAPVEANERERDPRVRYNDDDDLEEKERKKLLDEMFGPDEFESETPEEAKARDLARRKADQKYHTDLHAAILNLDVNSCELILMDMLPEVAQDTIFGDNNPLHRILVITYEIIISGRTTLEGENERREKCELVFRNVLPYLPNDIFAEVNEQKNTLLNLAINARAPSLVELFCALGSPLNIPNCFGASAIESALMIRFPAVLEILLQYGATFHYYVGEHLTNFDGEYLDKARRNLLLAEEPERSQMKALLSDYYSKIDIVCREIRAPFIRPSHRELDFGPIVCVPRGKLMYHGDKREIQFRMPNLWMHFGEDEEFRLIVIAMGWHEPDKRFYGSQFATKMHPPCINGVPCQHMNGIMYDATFAMREKRRHYENLKLRKEYNPSDTKPLPKGTLCDLRILFDPVEPLNFVACQVIRVKSRGPMAASTAAEPKPESPYNTTPRYYSPSSSIPTTPRI